MINNKNMFTYKIRKIGLQKESNNIIPDDPSNIFEFTNKKRKMINFDDILGKKNNPVKVINFLSDDKQDDNKIREVKPKKVGRPKLVNKTKCNLEESEKLVRKKSILTNENPMIKKADLSKKVEIKKIDLSKNVDLNKKVYRKKKADLNKDVDIKKVNFLDKEDISGKKNIPTSFASTFLDDSIEVLNMKKDSNNSPDIKKADLTINDCVTLTDILHLFCLHNPSEYAASLLDIISKDRGLFDGIHENELRELEMKIEEQDTQKDKWHRVKKEVEDENLIEIKPYIKKQVEVKDIEGVEVKVIGEVDTSKFTLVRDNMKSYLNNLIDKLSEVEQKIFNLTGNDKDLDPLILLNALTKFN